MVNDMNVDEALHILGFSHMPDEKALKDTYRSLVRRYHPDVSTEADAESRMAQVNEAYLIVMQALSERKKTKPAEQFSISAQSIAMLIEALDHYSVCPAMFRLIYDLKGALSTYYKAVQIGKPELIKTQEPMIKRAYLYLKIFQKVEPTLEVLPEDIRHSFMYRLGEFLAGNHWKDLSKEVNTLLEAYFRAYSLIVSLEGTERVHMPTLPSGGKAEPSPLGTFSAMSISGKIRSFAARLRLLLEPRVFKMPDELLAEVEEIGRQIADLTSLVYMATDLQKRLMKYSYFGPWMNEVKAYITKLVSGAVAIGDKDVDVEGLKLLYRSAVSVLDEMNEVRALAREVASLFFKAHVPYDIQEFVEKVSRGEVFAGKSWSDIPMLLHELRRYLEGVLSLGEVVHEVSALLDSIHEKISCLQCEDIDDAFDALKGRVWGRLSPQVPSTDAFSTMLSELRAIDAFLDVMSLEDCDSVSGVMRGLYSEEMLLRKMGRE